MRKAIKISSIVLGALLAAVLVIFIFFPGLPTYIRIKHKYSEINSTVPEFTKSEVPASFKGYSLKGVNFKVPADWKGKSAYEGGDVTSYRSPDEKSTISVIKHGKASYDLLHSSESTIYDEWTWEHSEEELRHFFDKMGCDYPDLWFDMWLIWLLRDGFTARDCLKLRGTDMDVFRELAEEKEEAFKLEDSWKISGEGFSGYIGHMTSAGYAGKGIWNFYISPDGSEDTYYDVMIKCPDETTARQLISSVTLK